MKSILVVPRCATSREIFRHWITVEIIVTRFAFAKRFFKGRFSLSRLYRAGYRYWQRGNRITLSCIIAMITVAYDAAIVRVKLNKKPKTSVKARCVIAYSSK